MSTAYMAIERLAEPIGFDIGQSNSKVQADLLNGLARGMNSGCDRLAVERQNCYIVDELTPAARTWVKALASMLETVEEDKKW